MNLLLSFLVVLVVGFIVAVVTVAAGIDPESTEAWRIWSAGLIVASFISGVLMRNEEETASS